MFVTQNTQIQGQNVQILRHTHLCFSVSLYLSVCLSVSVSLSLPACLSPYLPPPPPPLLSPPAPLPTDKQTTYSFTQLLTGSKANNNHPPSSPNHSSTEIPRNKQTIRKSQETNNQHHKQHRSETNWTKAKEPSTLGRVPVRLLPTAEEDSVEMYVLYPKQQQAIGDITPRRPFDRESGFHVIFSFDSCKNASSSISFPPFIVNKQCLNSKYLDSVLFCRLSCTLCGQKKKKRKKKRLKSI